MHARRALGVADELVCGLRRSGAIACWGSDAYGRISGPAADPAADFVRVAVGAQFVCGLRSSRTQREHGDIANDLAGAYVALDAADQDLCAVRSNGRVHCYGNDEIHQVSDANAEVATDFAQVATGGTHACGVRADRSLRCWPEWPEITGPNRHRGPGFVQLVTGQHSGLLCAIRRDGSHACRGRAYIDSRALIVAERPR